MKKLQVTIVRDKDFNDRKHSEDVFDIVHIDTDFSGAKEIFDTIFDEENIKELRIKVRR